GGLIAGFARNSTTGLLTPLPGSPYSSPNGAWSMSIDPSGRFAYVGALGISTFSIDQNTGALSLTSAPVYSTPGTPYFPAFDPTGQYIYWPDSEGLAVSGFQMNPNTGSLT